MQKKDLVEIYIGADVDTLKLLTCININIYSIHKPTYNRVYLRYEQIRDRKYFMKSNREN